MMSRYKSGGVILNHLPPGRVWIIRRKPVSIPDGKPWCVAWISPQGMRVRFEKSQQTAIAFIETMIGGAA